MHDENELDIVLREIMALWDIPGLAVGIVEHGETIYARGFGVQSLDTRMPVTVDSVFCVQSVSKCFVATAVMQMVERGKIGLQIPITQYLPYFRIDDSLASQITIQQLLSHTSGMPDMEEIEYVSLVNHPEEDELAAERFVRGLSGKKLIANPGERFSYSNIAYNVLGDLIAKVYARTFEVTMQENILFPACMHNSTFTPKEVPGKNLAWPHLRSPEMKPNPSYPYHRADAPSSFLHTTVLDMCNWAKTSLDQGRHLERPLLSSEGYDRMWTKIVERGKSRPSLYEDMGLGWTLGHYRDAKTVSHGGGGFGGTAFLSLLPERDRAVVVLCNEESFAHFRVLHAVLDALFDQTPHADSVSWMVPISRAMARGGLDEAYERYLEIKGSGDYYFDEGELVDLSLQLFTAGKIDLAIDILGFNLRVFPDHLGSILQQAKLYWYQGKHEQCRELLNKVESLDPGNRSVMRMLARIQ